LSLATPVAVATENNVTPETAAWLRRDGRLTRIEANIGEHFSNEVMAILPPCMARKLRHDTTHHVATARMMVPINKEEPS
jgi:hypothetical protein